MLAKRDTFFATSEEGIGLCGLYIPYRDSVHVGIFCNWQTQQDVVHFWDTNHIRFGIASNIDFENYYFHIIPGFPGATIDSLFAFAELISKNQLNNLRLNIGGIVYNGAKFEIGTGNYLTASDAENIINCGIFVLALFETYGFKLINWETWPQVSSAGRTQYLEEWLDAQGIPAADRDPYYKLNKEIRGKHVFVSPRINPLPAEYVDLEATAVPVLEGFRNNDDIIF